MRSRVVWLVIVLALASCTRTETVPRQPGAAPPPPGDALARVDPRQRPGPDAPLVEHYRHGVAEQVAGNRGLDRGCRSPDEPGCGPEELLQDAEIVLVDDAGDTVSGISLASFDGRGWCVTLSRLRGTGASYTGSGGMAGCSSDVGPDRRIDQGDMVALFVPTDVHELELVVGGEPVTARVTGLPREDGWHLAAAILPDGKSVAFVDETIAYGADGSELWRLEGAAAPDHTP